MAVPQATEIQVGGADFREEGSTAIALRQYWQTHFPGATFQNKEEFLNWYLKTSAIIVAIIGAIILWRRYRDSRPPAIIGPDHFVKFKVISRTKLAPDTLLIQLDLPRDALPPLTSETPLGLNVPIQSIYVADSDSMIQRPYTPLSADVFDPTSMQNTGKLSLLVKRYEAGEVSKWLHSRAVGAEVPIRGPVWTYDIRQRDSDDLVFIVAGTGITPAFQVLSSLYEPPELPKDQQDLLWGKRPNLRLEAQEVAAQQVEMSHLTWFERINAKLAARRQQQEAGPPVYIPAVPSPPRITVLYASQSTEDIPLRKAIRAYAQKYPDRIRAAFWADRLDHKSHANRVVKIGRMEFADLAKYGGKVEGYADPERTIVLVCGPDGFMETIAGPAPPNSSSTSSQLAPLGGLLHQLGWQGHQVIRLGSGQHLAQRIVAKER